MTVSLTTRAPAASNGLFRSLRDAVAKKVTYARVYARTRGELEAMSDRELADVGITRFMINEVAADAARRA